MKRHFQRIGAIVIAALLAVGSTLTANAEERSYTYNYDFWGDVQDSPDLYSVCKVLTSSDLKLDKALSKPEGIYVFGNSVYIMDTGNNRIIELDRTSRERLEVVRIIDEFKGAENNKFNHPTDMAISEYTGNIFIADKDNGRVLKLDKNLNYIMEFNQPNDPTLDNSIPYAPNKIVIDGAERVYCIATGVNKGLIKYESDGTFSGFVGATPATYNFTQYLYKKFASQEQLAKMISFVPTEYDNIYMDHEGFIYACTGSVAKEKLKSGDVFPVRRLNMLGSDILVRNGVFCDGKFPVYGDIYMGDGGGHSGPSYFSDVTCFDNDCYVCLDKNRGRLFAYDDQGRMIFACGGNGNMDGYFNEAIGIEHMDYDLFVLDKQDCAITIFTLTDFGSLVFEAMDLFDKGEYAGSQNDWEEVIDKDGNYDLAYIGIGRSFLRQKEYKTAMEYFELKYDDVNYSKAYRQYRKVWVEENIVGVVIVVLLLFLIPLGIGKVKQWKWEIETADIFKV